MPAYRQERVTQRVHQEISLLLVRDLGDPRLLNVNITRVEMSGDLRYAHVFVSPPASPEEGTEMLAGLRSAAGYIRHRLAESLDMKFAPELRFDLDRAIEKGERFLRVLEQVQAEERAAKALAELPSTHAAIEIVKPPRKRATLAEKKASPPKSSRKKILKQKK
ncbi:MAG: 30S ribosome-binding factor RbfA [Chloroflexi bacterium]|nr:30S ribosome-binding factor RbfA [Chloroflexota bacterium]